MHKSVFTLVFLFLCLHRISGQTLTTPSSRWISKKWDASWIAPAGGASQGVYHFRKTFTLVTRPEKFVIHLSADNRYRLFVNGKQLNDGPQISDSRHWRFESLDIAEFLITGTNTLAIQVWNLGNNAPVYDMGKRLAVIVQGDTETESVVNSDKTWKFMENKSITPIVFKPGDNAVYNTYYAAGPANKISVGMPWGWEQPAYDDSKWSASVELQKGSPFETAEYGDSQWELLPRSIPLMERTYQSFSSVRRSSGTTAGSVNASFTIAPKQKVSILLDQEKMTTAFPELIVSKGKGSEIRITYAEVVTNDLKKTGHRDSINGQNIKGVYDLFYPDGGQIRTFTTLSYRAFRYVQLDIVTGSEPLMIEKIGSWFTGYPFSSQLRFIASDKDLMRIIDVGWNTARLCAYETYMDCPYWERLQYIGDTRIQALISYYNSGDDRLARNALQQFEWSLQYDGLTYSRYPSSLPQYIPNYSLVWVLMVNDFMMYRNDPEFVKSFVPGIRRVMEHFKQYVEQDKMMGLQPYWDFLDHTYNSRKVIESGTNKRLATNSLFYAHTLDKAAEVMSYAGDQQTAEQYLKMGKEIKESVQRQCWVADKKMYADTPDKKIFSMHTNILAVLCGMISKAEQKELLARIVSQKELTPTTLYFDFYLGRAMSQAGAGDLYYDLLKKWKDYLKLGVTTFPEGVTRSECHAWSASPNFEIPATIAGVESIAPEFKKIAIRPKFRDINGVIIDMPHWAGNIGAFLGVKENVLKGNVHLPGGTTGILEWNGKVVQLAAGDNVIEIN